MPMQQSHNLDCRNLRKEFGGVKAIRDVSISFQPGKVTALVGPNGAGKTTLFHLVSGTVPLDSGEVWYGDRRLDRIPPWRVARLGVSRMFQDTRVFSNLTVIQNVLVAFKDQIGENPLWALLRRATVLAQETEHIQEAQQWLRTVGLEAYTNTIAGELSIGQQKLLATARLLATGARVLLLDEPLAGVGPKYANALMLLMRELAATGRTVVIIEHNMRTVIEVADEVCFLEEGRVTATGSPHSVLGSPGVRAAYLGLEECNGPVVNPEMIDVQTT